MQKKRKPGKEEDNTMLELIAKLSDGYNKTKQELAEMTSRCSILENQNRVLKSKVLGFLFVNKSEAFLQLRSVNTYLTALIIDLIMS